MPPFKSKPSSLELNPPRLETAKAQIEPLLIDAVEAARLCGVGRTMWLTLHNSGKCPLPIRLGRRTLWRVEELRRWVAEGCQSRDVWQRKEFERTMIRRKIEPK